MDMLTFQETPSKTAVLGKKFTQQDQKLQTVL